MKTAERKAHEGLIATLPTINCAKPGAAYAAFLLAKSYENVHVPPAARGDVISVFTNLKNELAETGVGHDDVVTATDQIDRTVESIEAQKAGENGVGVEQADQPVRASPAVEDQRPDPLAR
ncbi:hypothetical protein C4556_01395 [Candidatus Parcubacteria bacterium]|nr:MAG: hypothetical protein C4556_01395 [Candidatus Parcubacteria bacterium]